MRVLLILILLSKFTTPVLADENPNPTPADTIINKIGTTYDSHPSAVTNRKGETWVAWHGYHAGKDSVWLKRVDVDGETSSLFKVSQSGKVHSPPTVVLLNERSVAVVWSARIKGRWQILARELRDGKWQEAVVISESESDSILPTAIHLPGGKMVVSWSAYREKRFQIRCRLFDGGRWQATVNISSGEFDSFRPVLAVDKEGEVWTFWDQYNGKRYHVKGRNTFPVMNKIEQISPQDRNCLTPTALATKHGLTVAWLQKEDIIGRPRVISQWHTLHAAIRQKRLWKQITDKQGKTAAAELTQGLVAKVEPKPVATGGYLGRRTAPMLVEDGDAIWLLWERKASHRGSTPKIAGDLLGRPMRDGKWQEKVLLHNGLVDYHLSHPHVAKGSHVVVLASQLPRNNRRIYHRFNLNLSKTKPFKQDEWTGWRAVDLPVEHELTKRQKIKIGKKSYQLFWADMHCHSALTCDAEGEHDELTHYARDRARLDVVVFTNNDFLYDAPLTEYEYALGNFFAKVYSRPKKFLSLPGFEWTSRIPGVKTVKLSDRTSWTAPFRNRSYPNHRSVVYPPSGGPVVRFPEVANNIANLNIAVEKAGGITFTQHDAFLPSGHQVEVGMELTSGWRNYIFRVPNLFHNPLNKGARLGFVANGDSHRRAPGLSGALTGIYAEELTAKSIFNALRQRRCFATNGSRIFVDARANGIIMGQDVPVQNGKATLNLHAIGTRPILKAVLVCDGKKIRTFKGNGQKELKIEHQETNITKGTHWYYWRISQEQSAPDLPGNMMAAHGHLAWSTPHWIVVK